MGVVVKVLEAIATKMAEIRARLDAIVEREQQLDQAIGDLARVQDRLKTEEAQAVERARALMRPAEDRSPMDDPSPW